MFMVAMEAGRLRVGDLPETVTKQMNCKNKLLVTTSRAPVTTSDALVSKSFLLLLVGHLLLLAMHLFLKASCYY